MKQVLRKINLVYYLIYTGTILLTIVGYLLNLTNNNIYIEENAFSSFLFNFLIAYVAIVITLSFTLFYIQNKKISNIDNEKEKFAKYKKNSIIRLLLIGSGLLFGIVIYYILHTIPALYCIGFSAISLIICKPSEYKIISDLKLEEKV